MANYSFAVWMVLSAGLLLLFVYAAWVNLRRRHMPEVDLDEIVAFLQPVNVEAFAEAMDVSQDSYLRHSHSPLEFQKLQRKRMRVAAEYLRRMSHNAALLQRVGYGQLRSSNPLVAAQAQELIDAGVHVRLYAFLGLTALFFRRISGLGVKKISDVQKMMSASLIPAYQSLRSKAQELTTLRDTGLQDALARSL
jgi:hypothetical protein